MVLMLGTAGLMAPRWRREDIHGNESAAIAILKNISSAQAQVQASGVIDANQDGAGEYGFFGEMSGSHAVRTDAKGGVGATFVSPPVLTPRWSQVRKQRVVLQGYVFQIFLPGQDGTWVGENPNGGSAGCMIDPQQADKLWLCYAWPEHHGWSGNRCFLVDNHGDVLALHNRNGRYSGDAAPLPGKTGYAGVGFGVQCRLANHPEDSLGDSWTVI